MNTATTTDNNAVRKHDVRKELFVDGYEVVIGIEIHCQLNTESKIFSSAPTDFGHEPNSQASIVDLGLPGVLPVLNAGVVDRALKFGIGVNLAGLPALSQPVGLTSNGLPIGLQLIGQYWQESKLLSTAHLFQQHTDHHLQHSTIAKETV